MISLKDKTYIVTGGAKGIGLATTAALVARGARVAMFGRDRTAFDRAVERLGPAVLPFEVDIADRPKLRTAIDQAVETLGGLDGLVNNAGICLASAIEKLDPDEVDTQVGVNFLAAIYACQAVIPHLRRRGSGRIVNVGSASARHMDEFAHISIYSATKAGIERFTSELREEVKADNIGVTLFVPGGTETSFGSGWTPDAASAAFAEWLARGNSFDQPMSAGPAGEAIARCLELPDGTAYDIVELRPNRPLSRAVYAEQLYSARSNNL